MINRLFLVFVLGLSFAANADDCQCCGISGDVIGAITNAALSNCSSNCVRLTPETCVQVKDGITNYLYSIDSSVDYAVLLIDNSIDLASTISTYLEQLQVDLESLKADMSPSSASTVHARINDMRRNMGNYVTNVIRNVDASGAMLYSNKTTGAFVNLQYNSRVGPEILNNLMPNLKQVEDALGYYERAESNKFDYAKQQIDDAISNLYPLSDQLGDFRMQLAGVQNELNQIKEDGVPLREMMESFDCEPCGKGGGSSGGGSGGTVDLTSIVAEVQALREDLRMLMDKLYDLLERYFKDYKSAADGGAFSDPQMTLDGYMNSADSNWFRRIERLLFISVALQQRMMDSDSTGSAPESPDNADAMEDTANTLEHGMNGDHSSSKEIVTSAWNRLKSSLSELLDALFSLNPNVENSSLDSVLYSYQGTGEGDKKVGSWEVKLDADESSFVYTNYSTVRKGFRILWGLLSVSLYTMFLCVYVKWVIHCVVFVLKSVNDAYS